MHAFLIYIFQQDDALSRPAIMVFISHVILLSDVHVSYLTRMYIYSLKDMIQRIPENRKLSCPVSVYYFTYGHAEEG
jgi:hypothetical protein